MIRRVLYGLILGITVSFITSLIMVGAVEPGAPVETQAPTMILGILLVYPLAFSLGAFFPSPRSTRNFFIAVVCAYVYQVLIMILAPNIGLATSPSLFALVLFFGVSTIILVLIRPRVRQKPLTAHPYNYDSGFNRNDEDLFNAPLGELPPSIAELIEGSELSKIIAEREVLEKSRPEGDVKKKITTIEDVTVKDVPLEKNQFNAKPVRLKHLVEQDIDDLDLPGARPVDPIT